MNTLSHSRARLLTVITALLLSSLLCTGCKRQDDSFPDRKGDSFPKENSPSKGPDPVRAEIDAFRFKNRGFYNSSNFSVLEKTMTEIRAGAPLFRDGAWKIYHFYDSLRCRDDEPESMWQLHERIHQGWEKAYPQSITARVAHADFLLEYAWHARGFDYADKVTSEGWRLFKERLAAAQEILKAAKPLEPKCPMWWLAEMRLALGQGWTNADFGRILAEAKQQSPQFHYYDSMTAKYLLPRWHGAAGDWEKAAAAEIQRPNGLGVEGYARTVSYLRGYYGNIFQESQASWPNTKAGFDVMKQKYPDSLEIVTVYCQLACRAGDRALAKQLFEQLNGYVDNRSWGSPSDYAKFHTWAFDEKSQ